MISSINKYGLILIDFRSYTLHLVYVSDTLEDQSSANSANINCIRLLSIAINKLQIARGLITMPF